MKTHTTPLDGLILIEPKVLMDNRGYFYEGHQYARYAALGIPPFLQDNVSRSQQNVIRGLHYQKPNAQGKLVGVTHGAVLDVVVDIRKSSPTFGQWFSVVLSDENHLQMYVPPGFAHGFCVLSPYADFYYKCTDVYTPGAEHGIIWNDPQLNIDWPIKNPILSPKDEVYPTLNEIPDEQIFS